MIEKRYDENILSDLHKEAFGSRPSQAYWSLWDSFNIAAKNAEWDYLLETAKLNAEEEAKLQTANLGKWALHISELASSNNVSLETAIKWDMEAMEADGDPRYYEYLWNIPYNTVEIKNVD